MTELTHVNQASFEREVLSAATPVLVDFNATWCGPCKMLDPIIEQLAEEWGDKVKVVQLDVDENADLAMRYQVMGVPTVMLFVKGEVKQRLTGYMPKKKLVDKLAPHL